MDRSDYDKKMEAFLSDQSTNLHVKKDPFPKLERDLNQRLLEFKKQNKINDSTNKRFRSTDASPPAIRGSIKHHKSGYPL